MIALRDYQERAFLATCAAWSAGSRRIVLVSPTGSGKGTLAVYFADRVVRNGRRVLWLAPRRELILDTAQRLQRIGCADYGIVLAGCERAAPTAPVQVCSVQTLFARGERPPADVIVWDECHHATASTYREIASAYPGATHLGLTATPERADGTALGNAFDHMLVVASVRELIAAGHLVACDVIGPARRERALAQDPVDALREHAAGRRAVVFAKHSIHARELMAQLGPMGARYVDGKTGRRERENALAAFAAGECLILVNVNVLSEGWDCPEAEVVILARAVGSTALFLQIVGRVLRPAPGKQRALLVDLFGAVHVHGLPDEDRSYALDGAPIKKLDKVQALTQCRVCGAVYRPAATCPRCGAALPPPELPKVRRRAIGTVNQTATREQKQRAFDLWCAEARARGYRLGWVGNRFAARFGHWPAGFRESHVMKGTST